MFNDEIIIRSQQRFKSDHHQIYNEEINKIALSSNDDKRIQTFDSITTYPYGTNAFMVCENEMILKNKNINKNKNKESIKMAEINVKNIIKNSQSQEIISKLIISKNDAQTLKNESQEVISELAASRNELEPLKNKSKALRDKSLVYGEELQLLQDESLLAKNKIYAVKKGTYVLKN